MKVFMSVDMEGISGIVDWDQCMHDKAEFPRGRELMTADANAAIQGALDAGATEIVVGDSHARMTNLYIEKLNPKAQLVQGRVKPLSMMQGIDSRFDAAMFVGYHSRVGTRDGTLAHTFSGVFRQVFVNNIEFGEPGLNATLAASFGVPLVFLAGDFAACREVQALIPGITTYATKKGIGIKTTALTHPQVAHEAIRKGVKEALTSRPPRRTRLPKSPYRLKVILARPEMADFSMMIPGVERKDATTLLFKHRDFVTVYGAFLCIMRLAGNAIE